jgi:FkbM family methyltransferase
MSIVMNIKSVLRHFGVDLVKYHSFWDDIAGPIRFQTIFDIGANEGMFSQEMRQRFPGASIFAFEPLRDCFETMNTRMNGDQKFQSWNVALGEEKGETTIHRSASHPSSSLLPMASLHKKLYPGSVEHTKEKIQIERLDDVMEEVSFGKPALAKIDVQGYEAGVIKGGKETLEQCDIVVVENSFVRLYEGQGLFGEIHDLLRELGFSYRGRSETHYDPNTKQPIYEDSVFMRN